MPGAGSGSAAIATLLRQGARATGLERTGAAMVADGRIADHGGIDADIPGLAIERTATGKFL